MSKQMAEEKSNEEQPTFKVADRRKFNSDGSLREGVVIEDTAAKPVLPPAPAASSSSADVIMQNTSDADAAKMPSNVSGADPADIFDFTEDEDLSLNSQPEFSDGLGEADAAPSEDEALNEMNIPGAENPASFANFLLSLASQAAAAMGMTENPMAGGGRRVDLESSRYWLEVLGMLHEKTKNNLLAPEQKLFDGLLADLRMQYVQIARAAEAQMRKQEEQLLKQAATKFTGKDILGR